VSLRAQPKSAPSLAFLPHVPEADELFERMIVLHPGINCQRTPSDSSTKEPTSMCAWRAWRTAFDSDKGRLAVVQPTGGRLPAWGRAPSSSSRELRHRLEASDPAKAAPTQDAGRYPHQCHRSGRLMLIVNRPALQISAPQFFGEPVAGDAFSAIDPAVGIGKNHPLGAVICTI